MDEAATPPADRQAAAPAKAKRALTARPVLLAPEMTAEQGIEAIARSCLGHLVANHEPATEGAEEAIHQARIALRRLRSLFSLFRPLLPGAEELGLLAEIKRVAGALGAVRDCDVIRAGLVAPMRQATGDDPGLLALERALQERRAAAHQTAVAVLRSRDYADLAMRLEEWVESRAWRRQKLSEASARLFSPLPAVAGPLLTKRHKAARRRGRGFGELAPAERHRLRIAIKRLRYAAEFLRDLYPAPAGRRYVKRLAALQDALGYANDVATARTLFARLHDDDHALAEAGGRVIGWHLRCLAEREPELVRRWTRFAESKPFWTKKG